MGTPLEDAAAKATADAAAKGPSLSVAASLGLSAKPLPTASGSKPKTPLRLVGRLGGAYSIEGDGFGGSGVVMVGGRVLETTSWRDNSIRGLLPVDLPAGKVVVKPMSGVEQVGDYPFVPPAVPPAVVVK